MDGNTNNSTDLWWLLRAGLAQVRTALGLLYIMLGGHFYTNSFLHKLLFTISFSFCRQIFLLAVIPKETIFAALYICNSFLY